jgi:hypothetical protein
LGDVPSDDGEVGLYRDLGAERRVRKVVGARPHGWSLARLFEGDETRREAAATEEKPARRDESFGDLESPRVIIHAGHREKTPGIHNRRGYLTEKMARTEVRVTSGVKRGRLDG